jgi:hypothetical protein
MSLSTKPDRRSLLCREQHRHRACARLDKAQPAQLGDPHVSTGPDESIRRSCQWRSAAGRTGDRCSERQSYAHGRLFCLPFGRRALAPLNIRRRCTRSSVSLQTDRCVSFPRSTGP